MAKIQPVNTPHAPKAIGPYSQAVKAGNLAFLSGQIPLQPDTMEIVDGGIEAQANQVFKNLSAVIEATGATLADVVKLTIYLTDLSEFPRVNDIMASYFEEPYPARATVEVSALPKGALVEVDAVVALGD
ncbi:MAG: RidA family protein [Gammaproteobacteria bacterium]|nr:RidA family protein [Pseudomonadales bacterium]MCP5347635.1 RidA family protein [Pseudomonadales bacterium]